MPTYFGIATHRIIYKSANFVAGLTVTAYIWSPSLVKSALQTLTEVSDGLYYLDYAFAAEGTYFGIFYENAAATTMGTFRINTMVDCNVKEVNDISLIGNGSEVPWGPA
ncbi:MAG: hypothetical protein ABIH34_04320 [Nanoarchaeota archaeon]